jgi:Flp pilus assembly protein TadG
MRWSSDRTLRADGKTQQLSNSLMTSETGMNAARRDAVLSRKGRRGVSAFVSEECGDMLVLAAVCLSVLMGGMALAVDAGFVHYRQCQLQKAADAAAIAAGLELGKCGNADCATMNTAAAQALIEDGVTSSTVTPSSSCTVSTSSGLAMIINVGPCVLGTSDPNYSNTHMAEVVLTEPQTTFFGAIFGIRTLNLQARAEAGDSYINTANSGGNCIYTKNLEFNSSDGTFTLNNCSLYDNGNLQTDNGDTAKATSFLYYGTWSPNNCNSSCSWTLGDSETQPTHTTTAQSDPLASLTPPTQPSTTYSGTTSFNSGTNGLSPGYYPNGFNINGGTVNLTPGLYYFNGSVNVDSGAALECTTCTGGNGVTLYFTSGTLQMNSNSTVQLTAPSTGSTSNGDVANMVLWYSTGNGSGLTIDTGSSSYFNGVIYLPNQTLTLNSGSGVTINNGATATALDVNNMIVDDSENFVINGSGGYLGGGGGKVLGSFALSE